LDRNGKIFGGWALLSGRNLETKLPITHQLIKCQRDSLIISHYIQNDIRAPSMLGPHGREGFILTGLQR